MKQYRSKLPIYLCIYLYSSNKQAICNTTKHTVGQDSETEILNTALNKKNDSNTTQSPTTMINVDDIWQKYLKDSRIEFACFSFHVGLLFHQLVIFQTKHRKRDHQFPDGVDKLQMDHH